GRVPGVCSRNSKAQVLPTEQHHDAVRTATGCAASAGDRVRGGRESRVSEGAKPAATSLDPGANPDCGGDFAAPLGRFANLAIA
ncbi:MAG: hypothetical protein ACRDS9_10450, partial [Pseudonocardiaceae bacterium]